MPTNVLSVYDPYFYANEGLIALEDSLKTAGWLLSLCCTTGRLIWCFMDFKMPVMDGYEASWLIKVRRPLLATLSPSLLLPLMR